jgi:hypothetical protein
MSESWFHRLEDDLRHVTQHLTHHGPTLDGEPQPQQQEPTMALADTSTALASTSGNLRTALEAGASALRDALDNHMTQLDTAISDVAAVASIADSPIVVAAAGALHVPPEVLDGFVNSLNALAAAFPKPAPVQPVQPEEAAA